MKQNNTYHGGTETLSSLRKKLAANQREQDRIDANYFPKKNRKLTTEDTEEKRGHRERWENENYNFTKSSRDAKKQVKQATEDSQEFFV